MGWNEPDKGKEPWKGKNQPPDLDEALKRVVDKLKRIFLGAQVRTNKEPFKKSNGSLAILMLSVVGFLFWVVSGIFIVDPAEQAIILRFGKYIETVGPGPHWIPRLISSKRIINVDRVLDYSYSAQMLTKDENLVAVSLAVQYRIGDLNEYLFNVANPEESLQQATSSSLRQVVGTTTLDQIITEGREVWGNQVYDTLVKTLNLYKTGILIVNVAPQPARAPESVQDAFDDAIKAQEDEKRFKEQAYAYAAKVVPIAEGNVSRILQEAQAFSKQVVLYAEGEVSAFLALLPHYTASPNLMAERMYLETMQKVLNKSSKIIVDSKSSNLLYVPLDQLIAKTSSAPVGTVTNSRAENNETNENDRMIDGRQFTRPIYRQGGNES